MRVNFTLDTIEDVAKDLLDQLDSKTVLFYGEMGAGKTTLIRALVKALGGTSEASSPTFSLINEYQVKDDIVYHFDFYRLDSAEEALDIGIDDYFSSGHYIFIEWPDKIDVLLPEMSVKIYIKIVDNRSRALDLEFVNS